MHDRGDYNGDGRGSEATNESGVAGECLGLGSVTGWNGELVRVAGDAGESSTLVGRSDCHVRLTPVSVDTILLAGPFVLVMAVVKSGTASALTLWPGCQRQS